MGVPQDKTIEPRQAISSKLAVLRAHPIFCDLDAEAFEQLGRYTKPAALKRAVYANRRRLKRRKSRNFQRLRSERCERTFAHVCDTGGMRRSWLKEVVNVSKRYLIAAAAHNLGRIMRKLFGVGKPRTLQDLADLAALVQLLRGWRYACESRWKPTTLPQQSRWALAASA